MFCAEYSVTGASRASQPAGASTSEVARLHGSWCASISRTVRCARLATTAAGRTRRGWVAVPRVRAITTKSSEPGSHGTVSAALVPSRRAHQRDVDATRPQLAIARAPALTTADWWIRSTRSGRVWGCMDAVGEEVGVGATAAILRASFAS